MSYVINVFYITQDIALTLLALIAFVLAIYLAIIPHEIAHGLVAKWNGDLTAQVNGRLTMNPIAHFDLVGFLMLITMGVGFAIAGVTYNLAAVIVGSFFYALVMFFEAQIAAASVYLYFFIATFLSLFTSVNLMLFLFNIIPLGPLDGFKIIEAYADRGNRFIEFLRRYGTYILIALFVLHFGVYYISTYAHVGWLQYVDILGLYLDTCSYWIGGGILSLFTMMFGMGPVL